MGVCVCVYFDVDGVGCVSFIISIVIYGWVCVFYFDADDVGCVFFIIPFLPSAVINTTFNNVNFGSSSFILSVILASDNTYASFDNCVFENITYSDSLFVLMVIVIKTFVIFLLLFI
jgi:hypothetical protein